ncbi:MAG TPA: hypothetical protein VLC94_07395 [Candidatus Acidoferrum sp.]|nr:hypothetical protein [Candidatus Acidoferrum sp.]
MRDPKLLTRADILAAATRFKWTRRGLKWTVMVGNREFPARTLVLEAASAPPNDSTNSHQAIEILKRLGFETRYSRKGTEASREGELEVSESAEPPDTLLELVSSVTQRIPEKEWENLPADLSKNVDHYLYGAKKKRE